MNREIVRVVPKTGSGRFVPERGEQTAAVHGVVDRANKLARHGYAVAWEGNKAADGERGAPSADDFLAETRRLEEDFTPTRAAALRAAGGRVRRGRVRRGRRLFEGRKLLESLEGYVRRRAARTCGAPDKQEPHQGKGRGVRAATWPASSTWSGRPASSTPWTT